MSENQKSVGLRIALPNGSLEEGTLRLFEEANLKIRKDSRKHDAQIDDPLISQVTFMLPQHIPRLVEKGIYDVGICGWDCVCESNTWAVEVAKLSYGRGTSSGKAKIVLITSKDNPAQSIREVERGSVVLSEYPNRTKECFAAFHIPIGIDFSYGGTEAHILRDYLYGVCLSDTGASIAANGLKIIHTLLETHTSVIVSREIWLISSELEVPENPKQEMVKALVHLLLGVLDAREQVFLVMNVSVGKKGGLLQQLPALKTPTVTPPPNNH